MRLPERLPRLEGRLLTAFRVLWWGFFLLALAAIPARIATERLNYEYNEKFYSIGIRGVFEDGVETWSPISDAPATADIVPRSHLEAIGGVPFPPPGPVEIRVRALRAGFAAHDGPVPLDLVAPDGREYRVVVPPDPTYLAQSDRATGVSFETRFWTRAGTGALINLMMLVVAVLLFRRQAGEPVPSLLSIGILAILSQYAFLYAPDHVRTIAPPLLYVIASGTIYTAFLTFPDARLRPKMVVVGFALFLPLWASPIGELVTGRPPDLPVPQFVWVALIPLVAVIAIALRYRRADALVRQQIKWGGLGIACIVLFVPLGEIITSLSTSVSDLALQGVYFYAATIASAMAQIGLLVGLLIALLRYRLYDAEVALGNSLWVGALTISLLLIFAASEQLFAVVGERLLGEEMGLASGAIAAGLAAVLAGPLYTRLHRWAERTFQRDMVRLRDGLPALVGDLRETETPPMLAETILARVDEGVRAKAYALVFEEEGERVLMATRGVGYDTAADWLATRDLPDETVVEREDRLFPIRVPLRADGTALKATLLVGRRADGTTIGKDERRALEAIADPIARALAVSLRRTRRIDEEKAERSALLQRIARLEKLVATGPRPDPA